VTTSLGALITQGISNERAAWLGLKWNWAELTVDEQTRIMVCGNGPVLKEDERLKILGKFNSAQVVDNTPTLNKSVGIEQYILCDAFIMSDWQRLFIPNNIAHRWHIWNTKMRTAFVHATDWSDPMWRDEEWLNRIPHDEEQDGDYWGPEEGAPLWFIPREWYLILERYMTTIAANEHTQAQLKTWSKYILNVLYHKMWCEKCSGSDVGEAAMVHNRF